MSWGKSWGAKFFGGVLVGALCLVMAQADADLAQSSQPSPTKSTRQAPFTLTIENDLISLTARDASIKAILEELGRRMNIAVVAAIPPDETISTEFTKITLKEALTRLITNYAYVTDSAKDTGRITKIVVTPPGEGVARAASLATKSTREVTASQPEPFKFEFDPTVRRSQ